MTQKDEKNSTSKKLPTVPHSLKLRVREIAQEAADNLEVTLCQVLLNSVQKALYEGRDPWQTLNEVDIVDTALEVSKAVL